MSFDKILEKYRKISFSERDKGDRFERLMQAYLHTDRQYSDRFEKVWLWNEFPYKDQFGGSDLGIDLVTMTPDGEYWAVQCKFYDESSEIDKGAVDSFLSTSSKNFKDKFFNNCHFSTRLWISTTNQWNKHAEETIKNQTPPVTRLNLHELREAQVDWEKLDKGLTGSLARNPNKQIRPHQQQALEQTHKHFKSADRGKLIMACGTGKTFVSLRIAEHETNGKGLILFLVPSIALLSQTLREWSADAKEPINAICICSDPKVSRKKSKNEDSDNFNIIDLALPATTDVKGIVQQFSHSRTTTHKGLTVVFSTYQSIEVIAKAQKELQKKSKFGEFDLIICDEAHRTTGVTLSEQDSSTFVKVHDNSFIKAKKRLYMTATPRLYSDDSKSKAAQANAILCSMDDVSLYGEEIYRIGFGQAVEKDLLSDYKVLILTLSDKDVPPAIQKMVADKEYEINSDDASKLIGCVNALSKKVLGDEGIIKSTDPDPMRRAVAFCQKITVSKKITATFNDTAQVYVNSLPDEDKDKMVAVASRHIDGSMTAPERDELMNWLKTDSGNSNECRILTNVRCLSEGVDVPSLDAVMFLSAKNSQVDVVQSVGRVMRKSPGKKYGYIIIPVVVPNGIEAHHALDDNERYKVVWTVLNALRAHDDRFNAIVNKIELNKRLPEQILVGRPEYTFEEGNPIKPSNDQKDTVISKQLAIQFEQLQSVVFARMVQKVGDRRYWEQWAKDVSEIAEKQVIRINRLIKEKGPHQKAFTNFVQSLRKNINPSISDQEAIEMLSQHIITKPVFEALFDGYSFVKNNSISESMQEMIDLLEAQAIEKDTETLNKFYDSVKMRASGIDNAEGKQRIITELYEKFFKNAFPKIVEMLGIVFTPVEVVDFMIHSVEDVLKKEFGRSISDKNIHIIDPFTGTGTFITRLLQSGLISKKDLERKFASEIHANEIVLLAYYIASINIENAYHDVINAKKYKSFDGICLTDTFQLGEKEGNLQTFKEMFPENTKQIKLQKKAPIRVIIGNPPYSIGQKSANDNAQNQSYPVLDARIANTYSKESSAGLNKSLYDSYIKAFRWSSDRLDPKHGGIICFISNGSWIDGNATSGFRKCLEKEFSSIYVFNLRGNQRTSGELSRKEGGKIFGSGSRTPITITLLIKKPSVKREKAEIFYHDIGDYLSRENKLEIVKQFSTVMNKDILWDTISPNKHGDWINHRNDMFDTFIPLAPVKKFDLYSNSFFNVYSNGVVSSRDSWVYNCSQSELLKNMDKLIGFYNIQVKKMESGNIKEIDNESKMISWSANLKKDLINKIKHEVNIKKICIGLYRPFTKEKIYLDKNFIERPGLNSMFFPLNKKENFAIGITGIGSSKGFSTLITKNVFDFQTLMNGLVFPLYYFEKTENQLKNNMIEFVKREGVSDFIQKLAKQKYNQKIDKEDIFYYVYGFLHSPEYREMFVNDLKKKLPRLPLVKDIDAFWIFSKAGRALADLHINYEKVPANKDVEITGIESGLFSVEKMCFPSKTKKDTIIFNSKITISNIPAKAYGYIVNGKSAIEWIMERYQVNIDKKSGIKNDPNDWAKEEGNPRYILDLLLSIINVSVKTVEIIENLPKLDFGGAKKKDKKIIKITKLALIKPRTLTSN